MNCFSSSELSRRLFEHAWYFLCFVHKRSPEYPQNAEIPAPLCMGIHGINHCFLVSTQCQRSCHNCVSLRLYGFCCQLANQEASISSILGVNVQVTFQIPNNNAQIYDRVGDAHILMTYNELGPGKEQNERTARKVVCKSSEYEKGTDV